MLRDHRAVQVQVDGIEGCRSRGLDDLAGDAFVGVVTLCPCPRTKLMKPLTGKLTFSKPRTSSPRARPGKSSPRTKLS
jgi:hypothetical protein